MFRLAGLLLALCLAVAPLATAQTATQTEGAIAVEDSATQDAAIATRIRSILGELGGYHDVTVAVSSGVVTLRGAAVDAEAIARLEELTKRVQGVVAIENEVRESAVLADKLNPAVERFRKRMAQLVAFLPIASVAVVSGLLVLLLGLFIARWRRPWDRLAPNAFIADIYRQFIRIAFAIIGLVIALDIVNATALLGTILGAAGIIGLALGFAVRDTVENFIASILLSIRQPFRPNDAVEIQGDEGKVIRLTSRATILLSFDGNHIRIPNATVYKARIVNYTRNDERRFMFQIGVEADSDLAAVRALMEQTVEALPFTLAQPGISVWIEDITDSGVIFTVTGWIDQRETSLLRARGEALRFVKHAIEKAGYAIPDTTYRIRLEGAAEAALAAAGGPGRPSGPAPAPPPETPVAPAAPEAVDTKDDQALEQMIKAERSDRSNPDLLRRDAPEE